MHEWIMSLLLALAPHAVNLDAVATAIDEVAHESPIYDANDGPERTALDLVAVSFFESSFRPDAVKHDAGGDSVGLAQVNVSNLRSLGMTRDDLFDPKKNLLAAVSLMRVSRRACRGRSALEQLAQYASGGNTCSVPEGLAASRHRLGLARVLHANHPTRWVDPR